MQLSVSVPAIRRLLGELARQVCEQALNIRVFLSRYFVVHQRVFPRHALGFLPLDLSRLQVDFVRNQSNFDVVLCFLFEFFDPRLRFREGVSLGDVVDDTSRNRISVR